MNSASVLVSLLAKCFPFEVLLEQKIQLKRMVLRHNNGNIVPIPADEQRVRRRRRSRPELQTEHGYIVVSHRFSCLFQHSLLGTRSVLVVLQTMMKDFLGNEYGPGDLVLYAAASGRSITMILGRVVSVTERQNRDYRELENGKWGYVKTAMLDRDGNQLYGVRIQPLNSSRWEHHDQRPYYVDNRTGEKINRREHVKVEGHFTLNSTGEVLPSDRCEYMRYVKTRRSFYRDDQFDMVPEKNPDYIESHLRTYHRTIYNDYVEERQEGAKPVTITVTENIVKWNGELPDVH
jgi:hypothetical protein